jgi:hypothetical protein
MPPVLVPVYVTMYSLAHLRERYVTDGDMQSTIGVIRSSLKAEGPMFMFKGWVPAFTRLQPTTILIFLTLEQLKNLVDWTRGVEKQA